MNIGMGEEARVINIKNYEKSGSSVQYCTCANAVHFKWSQKVNHKNVLAQVYFAKPLFVSEIQYVCNFVTFCD